MSPVAERVTAVRLDVEPRGGAGNFRRCGEPVTVGLPLQKGILRSAGSARIVDRTGRAVPAQASASELWSDGSVRWILVRFLADTDDNGRAVYRLVVDEKGSEIAAATC